MDTQLTQLISSSSFSPSSKNNSLNSSSNDIQLDLPFSYVHHELQGKLRDKCTELNNKLRNLSLKKYNNNNDQVIQEVNPPLDLTDEGVSNTDIIIQNDENEIEPYASNAVELDHSISGEEEAILNIASADYISETNEADLN